MTTRLTDATAPIEFLVVVMVVVVMVAASDANADAWHADDRPMVVMVVVMTVVAVMVMMAIAGDLHLTGLARDVLLARRTGRSIGRPQRRDGVRDRVEQLGERVCASRLRRRRGRGRLCGRVECRQPGDGADGADEFLIHESFSLWFVSQRTHLRRPGACAATRTGRPG